MTEAEEKAQLDALEKRIAALKAKDQPAPKLEEHYSQAQVGWRMVSELVVGLLIGAALGYGLDYWLNTLPVFLILFTLLGFAAGVRVMIKTAQEVTKTEGKQDGGQGR